MSYDERWIVESGAWAGVGVIMSIVAIILLILFLLRISGVI